MGTRSLTGHCVRNPGRGIRDASKLGGPWPLAQAGLMRTREAPTPGRRDGGSWEGGYQSGLPEQTPKQRVT